MTIDGRVAIVAFGGALTCSKNSQTFRLVRLQSGGQILLQKRVVSGVGQQFSQPVSAPLPCDVRRPSLVAEPFLKRPIDVLDGFLKTPPIAFGPAGDDKPTTGTTPTPHPERLIEKIEKATDKAMAPYIGAAARASRRPHPWIIFPEPGNLLRGDGAVKNDKNLL